MSDGMRRELVYLSSHATNRYFIPNWGKIYRKTQKKGASQTYDTPSSLELFSHQKTNLTEMTMTEFDRDFVLHFDNCPGKISHFVSLSFCVIFVFEREKCSI